MITGFLTGSRVYGQPRDDSDLDLCMLVTQRELELLREVAESADDGDLTEQYDNARVLRFGKLNVVCFVHNQHENEFLSFALGTEKMRHSKVVYQPNRDQAVVVIQSLIGVTL